jgi:hypothetical protein
MDTETSISPKQNLANEVRTKIAAVAAAATDDERKTVKDILALAAKGQSPLELGRCFF